jgi:hypothetical protein
MQVGLGVVTGSMSPVFNQGAIESTASRPTRPSRAPASSWSRAPTRRSSTPAPATSV